MSAKRPICLGMHTRCFVTHSVFSERSLPPLFGKQEQLHSALSTLQHTTKRTLQFFVSFPGGFGSGESSPPPRSDPSLRPRVLHIYQPGGKNKRAPMFLIQVPAALSNVPPSYPICAGTPQLSTSASRTQTETRFSVAPGPEYDVFGLRGLRGPPATTAFIAL